MSKPWLAHYPAGVPADIDVDRYQSLVQLAEEAFAEFPTRDAYVQMGRAITYADLEVQSAAFGAWLQQHAGRIMCEPRFGHAGTLALARASKQWH